MARPWKWKGGGGRRTTPDDGPIADPDPVAGSGGPGGILADPGHRRRDAITAVQLLRLGCFTPEQTRDLLDSARKLAVAAAAKGKSREFVALVKLILEAAKLESAERARTTVKNHAHLHVETDANRLSEIASELGITGIFDADPEPGSGEGESDS